MEDRVRRIVAAWLHSNALDYTIGEVHADIIMLRPNGGDLPMALIKTRDGWMPFVYADLKEEGWTPLWALDGVVT